MISDTNTSYKNNNQNNPFAPAEMYLSDMIGSNINPNANKHGHGDDENEEDFLLVNVSDSLVFSPPKLDPLWGTDLQGSIIELLQSLKQNNNSGVEGKTVSFHFMWNMVECLLSYIDFYRRGAFGKLCKLHI